MKWSCTLVQYDQDYKLGESCCMACMKFEKFIFAERTYIIFNQMAYVLISRSLIWPRIKADSIPMPCYRVQNHRSDDKKFGTKVNKQIKSTSVLFQSDLRTNKTNTTTLSINPVGYRYLNNNKWLWQTINSHISTNMNCMR